MSEPRSLFSSAKLIALCTLVSRVAGLARDVLIAQAFGLGRVQDAFRFAFLIPNIFRRLFGEGALAAAFVPTFTRTIENEGPESAWRLLARTFGLLSLTLAGVLALIEIVVLVAWLINGQADDPLVYALTAIMAPFMLTVCIVALLSAALNCMGSFVPAALTPVILNLGMIAALLWVMRPGAVSDLDSAAMLVAVSVIVSGLAQIVVLAPALRRRGVPLGWRLDVRDPQVRGLMGLMAPVMVGQGALLLSTYIDGQLCLLLRPAPDGPPTFQLMGMTLAYPLTAGALSAISVAQNLYQFPLGLLAISLAVAALPVFSRLAARGDWPEWGAQVRSTLRMAIFEGLPVGAMMVTLAEPIVRLLFEHGRFDADDTSRAARVVQCYGIGMWAMCAQQIVLRAFYSVGDVRTPLRISCWFIPLNLALSLALLFLAGLGERSFALSTAITSTLTVVVGLIALRSKAPATLIDRDLCLAAAKMLLAAGLAGWIGVMAVDFARPTLEHAAPFEFARRAIEALGGLGLIGALYAIFTRMLGLRETKVLLGRLTARFAR